MAAIVSQSRRVMIRSAMAVQTTAIEVETERGNDGSPQAIQEAMSMLPNRHKDAHDIIHITITLPSPWPPLDLEGSNPKPSEEDVQAPTRYTVKKKFSRRPPTCLEALANVITATAGTRDTLTALSRCAHVILSPTRDGQTHSLARSINHGRIEKQKGRAVSRGQIQGDLRCDVCPNWLDRLRLDCQIGRARSGTQP